MYACMPCLPSCLPACLLAFLKACMHVMYACMFLLCTYACLYATTNYKCMLACRGRLHTLRRTHAFFRFLQACLCARTHTCIRLFLPQCVPSFILCFVFMISLSLSFSHIHKYRHACMHACMHRIIHSCIFVYISSGLLACLHADLQKYVLELKPLNRLSGTL